MSDGSSDLERDLEGAAPLLRQTMTRRGMLRITGGTLAGILLASCGFDGSSGEVGETTTDATGQADQTTAGRPAEDTRGIVFNTASRDVTLFDPTTNRVTGSEPTNAVVRWLSNEQHYWDGTNIWTYDFPDNELEAIAVDPRTFEVIKRVPVDGAGPGHSFVLSPNNERGFVNSAGSDFLAVIDPVAGEVIEQVEMGAFPWDVDLSPDGSFGYIPERDQDTVAMLDTQALKITQRVEFPQGSLPWMLRISPSGREVFVQTASGSNVVLDAQTLEILYTEELGSQPVTSAWSPDGRYNFVTHAADTWVAVSDPETGRLIKRLEVGQNSANVSFRPDGKYGYVAVTGEDVVAVVEMESLEVETRIGVGQEPMGLILL